MADDPIGAGRQRLVVNLSDIRFNVLTPNALWLAATATFEFAGHPSMAPIKILVGSSDREVLGPRNLHCWHCSGVAAQRERPTSQQSFDAPG